MEQSVLALRAPCSQLDNTPSLHLAFLPKSPSQGESKLKRMHLKAAELSKEEMESLSFPGKNN